MAASSQHGIDSLHHEIMNFHALVKGDFSQRLIDGLRQVEAGVYHGWPLRRLKRCSGRLPRGSDAAVCHNPLEDEALVIAKLDRLSRNVAFIAAMDSRVEFVACDNPHATPQAGSAKRRKPSSRPGAAAEQRIPQARAPDAPTEVAKLIEEAKGNRNGQRDATMIGFRASEICDLEWSAIDLPGPSCMLRHSAGYKLAGDGHDTRSIQDYLGHRDIRHTVRYTELSPKPFRDFWRD